MATRATSDASQANEEPLRLRFDRFELDEADARLTMDGEPVALAPKPFGVLCALARAPQKLLATNALLDCVWGHRFVSESVLKSAISELRAALQDDARSPRYIETVSRRGYRFIGRPTAPPPSRSVLAPLPHAAPGPTGVFVGRTDELARLHSAWRAVDAGGRRIAWVAGEAGVGKTRLIERFVADIGDVHCAYGQSVEQHGAGEPYLPVLEALTALSRRDPSLAELIRTVAPSWMLQLPWLCSAGERDALRNELGGTGEARMLREMGELLDRYTQRQPLLLVTEDLHWCDPRTVQLIDYMARRRNSARVLWLASFRLTEVVATDHALKSLRRELRLHGLCDEIVLDAFSQVEVADYLAQRLPRIAGEERFIRTLHDRTDGLPLFVADVVDDLAGRSDSTDALDADWSVPEGFAGIVERYFEQLAAEERAALEAASVCGADFRLASVAHLLDTDVASIAQICLDLERAGRWLKDVSSKERAGGAPTRFAFRHRVYRDIIYRTLGSPVRAAFHHRLAACDANDRTSSVDAAHPRSLRRRDGEPAAA